MSKFKVGDMVIAVAEHPWREEGPGVIVEEDMSSFPYLVQYPNGERHWFHENCVELYKEETMSEKGGDVLTVTKDKVLEAAGKCGTAKDILKTIFPEAFKSEWEAVYCSDITVEYYSDPVLRDKVGNLYFWDIIGAHIYPGMREGDARFTYEYKLEDRVFYRRRVK